MISSSEVRALLEQHGECRSQSASDWAGEITLPNELERFYHEVGPSKITVPGYGNPTYLPTLAEMWDYQAGYRWDGNNQPIEDWNSGWVVVADEGADPYILSEGRILLAEHGMGSWEPGEIYPDLNTMAACIATLGLVVKQAGEEFTDEDCYVQQRFKEEAVQRLKAIVGSASQAQAIVDTAGWG